MLSKLTRWSVNCVHRISNKIPVAYISNRSQEGTARLKYSNLIKPFVFTVTVCGSSFACATIWQHENKKNETRLKFFENNNVYKPRQNKVQSDDWVGKIKESWDSLSSPVKVYSGIALLNLIVFGCWRIPRLHPFMVKYFISTAETKSFRCLPMILSNFSHYSPMHLGLNMLVLYSFSNIGVQIFGKENFLALYLSSGIISSFASLTYKVVIQSVTPSLGASGAILGILASTCTECPNIQLMIVFLPFFSFSSATALKGIILLDSLGLIFKWGFFDHAAHLGGTLFGIYYSHELQSFFNDQKFNVIKYWNELKSIF